MSHKRKWQDRSAAGFAKRAHIWGTPHFARFVERENLLAATLALLAVITPLLIRAETTATLNDQLPAGAMQQKATTACLECHEARIILQQRLSKPAWTKEVDKMTKWGAVVDAADRDPLIDYLSENFSPDKPPYVPPRSSREKPSTRNSSR